MSKTETANHSKSAHRIPYDELAELAGVSPAQRVELGVDVELARTLLAEAVSKAGVRAPAAYAVAAFRKRRAQSASTRNKRIPGDVSVQAHEQAREQAREPEAEVGPPDEATIAWVIANPDARAMLGPAIAASLRFHGREVPSGLVL